MLRRYKLRLGDGTVLLVDHDGLSTWLVDRKAMVQAGKAGKWIPLKEFLVHLRAAEMRAAREQAVVPEERERTAAREERRRAAEREERRRAAAREQGEWAARRGANPPAAATPARERDGLPLVPPPPGTGDEPPSTPPPSPREDGLPLVPPPPAEAAPSPSPPTRGDDAPLFIPPAPAQDVPMAPSPPEVEAPPAAPPDERESPLSPAAASDNDPDVRITVGEPRLVGDEASGGPAAPEPPAEDEPPAIGEPPGVQALADEPTPGAPHSGSTPPDDVPVLPLKPLEDDGGGRRAEPPREAEPPPVQARPAVQSLADDPGAPPASRTGNTWTGATWDDEPAVIPLKPPDEEEATTRRPAKPRPRATPSFADDADGGPLWDDGPAASVLRAVGAFGTFLSRCLDPLNRLERGQPPFLLEERPGRHIETSPPGPPKPASRTVSRPAEVRPLAEEPILAADEPRRPSTDDSLVSLESLHERFSDLTARTRGLVLRVRSSIDGLTARLSRRLRREVPHGSSPPERLAAAATPPPPSDTAPEPRVVPQAPPALSELPALRLKPVDEPRSEDELYDEDVENERTGLVSVTWVWTRRLVVAAVLLGLGALAVLNRDVWLPRAADLGERTLSQIDEQVRSGHFARQQQRAVEEAARQLPHLAPETIRLIMSSSPVRVLEAPDVFEIACDATDRGLGSLTPGDAEELRALRREMLAALRPKERERIREFDRARGQALVFPLDVQQALRSYARGARELSPHSRERLQKLLGEAIAAGLTRQTQLTPTASVERP